MTILSAPSSPPPGGGLPATPAPLLVRIVGRKLPGRACGPYTDVRVGMPQRQGEHPETIPADVAEAVWETHLKVSAGEGGAAFRGPAVHGPPHERFLYLTWIGRMGGEPPAMFRRAKLRLDAVPAQVLTEAIRTGVLVGEVDLTDPKGMPLCASVRPPILRWFSGPA